MIKTSAAISAATLALTLSFSSAYAYVESKPAVSVKLELSKSKGITAQTLPIFIGTTLTANVSSANNTPVPIAAFEVKTNDDNSDMHFKINDEGFTYAPGKAATYKIIFFDSKEQNNCPNELTILPSKQIIEGSMPDYILACLAQ